MNYERLLDERKIERVEESEFEDSLAIKDIEFAENGMVTENYDRVMSVVYEAVLRLINSLMNFLGFRSIGKEHHKHSFEFLIQSGFDNELCIYFDNIRRKRNNFIYRDVVNVSKEEAEEILDKADDFVHKMRTFVLKIRIGGKGL